MYSLKLVTWCFEPSQPDRVISGLSTRSKTPIERGGVRERVRVREREREREGVRERGG